MLSTWPEFPITDFSAGMIDKVDDNHLPANAARDCRNFICKALGSLEKRSGQSRLNNVALPGPPHGLYAYYNGEDVRKLLVVAGNKLFAWNSSTEAFDELRSGLDESALTIFETCANYVVGMDGMSAPWKWSGTGTPSVLAGAPATGRYPVLFQEKLFCVPGDNLSQIWWSESFAPEDWPAINYWSINEGDGDIIKGLKAFQGSLVIFKGRSTHLLRGNSLANFRLDPVDTQIGCVGPLAAADLGNRLYFVSDEGLYYFNGMNNVSISSNAIPLLWNDIDKKNLGNACVTSWNDLVWFSLPLQSTFIGTVDTDCTNSGFITVKVGGIEKKVAVVAGEGAWVIAKKIGNLSFDGWSMSNPISSIFEIDRQELRQPLDVFIDGGDTGITTTVTKSEQKTNNLVIMYDPIGGGRFWPTSGIRASCFHSFNDGSSLKLYSGDSINGYVNLQDIGNEDFGNPISAYWVGKAFDMEKADYLKKAKKAFVEDHPNQDEQATLMISLDYGDFHEWAYKHDDGMVREYRIPSEHKQWWRYLTPKISHNTVGGCQIRGLRIPYKSKKKPKGRTP